MRSGSFLLLLLHLAFPRSGLRWRSLSLQTPLTWASLLLSPLASMFCCTTSLNLSYGLPVALFPSTSIFHPLLPGSSSSLRSTCPYHFSLLSLKISLILTTPTLLLISSFFTLSINLVPNIHLSIFISILSSILFSLSLKPISALHIASLALQPSGIFLLLVSLASFYHDHTFISPQVWR